ncbi:hypothetical protein SBRY_30108 [Actinacidiphila bryophytorum]|uniref:Uncharacterized protein n=1 Tax=Actinacidiphila bryophytorum TaxID=1436133 RepID=A0A9W4MAW4_9ACTN|nr:hypothetical protein SBRY_30108 [Actinacidiphila bryophytorum]
MSHREQPAGRSHHAVPGGVDATEIRVGIVRRTTDTVLSPAVCRCNTYGGVGYGRNPR